MLKLLFYLHGDYSDSIMESTAAAAPTSTIVEISPQHQTQDSKNIEMALKASLDMQSLVPPETETQEPLWEEKYLRFPKFSYYKHNLNCWS